MRVRRIRGVPAGRDARQAFRLRRVLHEDRRRDRRGRRERRSILAEHSIRWRTAVHTACRHRALLRCRRVPTATFRCAWCWCAVRHGVPHAGKRARRRVSRQDARRRRVDPRSCVEARRAARCERGVGLRGRARSLHARAVRRRPDRASLRRSGSLPRREPRGQRGPHDARVQRVAAPGIDMQRRARCCSGAISGPVRAGASSMGTAARSPRSTRSNVCFNQPHCSFRTRA